MLLQNNLAIFVKPKPKMEANYDEDLQRNSFFKELQEKYVNIFNQAIDDGWVICIPRSGSFNKTIFSENDFLNHILVPVQDSVGECRSIPHHCSCCHNLSQ